MFNEPPSTRTVRLVVWEAHWQSIGCQPSTRLPLVPFLFSLFFRKDWFPFLLFRSVVIFNFSFQYSELFSVSAFQSAILVSFLLFVPLWYSTFCFSVQSCIFRFYFLFRKIVFRSVVIFNSPFQRSELSFSLVRFFRNLSFSIPLSIPNLW